MASVIPLPSGARTEHRSLTFWMDRVLKELDNLRKSPEPDAVHDLRVALRRCRSLAAVMEEVDAHPAWEEMRKAGRNLFRSLGALRDVQVQQEWLKRLSPEADALGSALMAKLSVEEKKLQEKALRKAARFDDKHWKQLARTLGRRVRLVPPESPAAECLALERLEDAKELHRRALRTERPKPWHKLRIGVKRFRYTVEGLLPEHYAAWSEDLKRVQDLLGDVHDLDVLRGIVRKEAENHPGATPADRAERIAKERATRIEAYRQLALGTTSLWNRWRMGLPSNGKLEAAATMRLRATARACDPHRQKTGQAARFAKAVFAALRRARCGPVFSDAMFSDARTQRIFAAAAILHGIRPSGYAGAQHKAARKFLAALPAPAGWILEDWQLLGSVVRYSRGKEPKNGGGSLARLSDEEKIKIFSLAGVLKVGRELRKIGVATSRGIRAEASPEAVTIRVADLPDTPEVAAKLAAAKHLLERGLGKPIVFRIAEARQKVLVLPANVAAGQNLAAASD